MPEDNWVLTRFLHGNEPIIIALGIARCLSGDIILPVPEARKGFVAEIAAGKGIDSKRVYMDSVAAGIASRYGVIWAGGMKYEQWVASNEKSYDDVRRELRRHYQVFSAANLEGEVKTFIGPAKITINAGDIYDGFGAPVVYAFPHRLSEILGRNAKFRNSNFVHELRRSERARAVNFIPKIHTLSHDRSYSPLERELFTPHVKEAPVMSDIELPEDSIAMVFSGTGKKIDALRQVAECTSRRVVTGMFSPVDENNKYVKITPPSGEFVHVYAKPQIRAVVAQPGFGTLWSAWNAGKPVIFPAFEEGDDEEFIHNKLTITNLNLGLEIERPDQIDGLVERSQSCVPAIKALNAELVAEFGTLDGPAYIAGKMKELSLY
ncbi:MAG: hypothetical protein HYS53_01125 [Candidatus Aenigmarchaeota archaeon]|nr:hypothetical protein [Candidatus Aenigmarchaeota archaeon]